MTHSIAEVIRLVVSVAREYLLQSSLGWIRQERRHLGAHHASTGTWYHGKIVQGITCERSINTTLPPCDDKGVFTG
jgi:hypothetical protein